MRMMKEFSEKEIRKTKHRLFVSGVCCMLVLIIFIRQAVSFGWFSGGDGVDATGMSVEVTGGERIIVSKIENGPDITDELLTITPEEGTKISPGSSGLFTAWISIDPTAASFDLHVECRTKNLGANNVVTEITDDPVVCANYIKTHIAFFLSYENGLYSDWVIPGEGITINGQTQGSPLTVYWVWIEKFDDLKNSLMYDVGTHYEENMDMWFAGLPSGTVWSDSGDYSDYYNNADYAIGEGLNGKNICFSIDITLP